jgi:hypothetical protein
VAVPALSPLTVPADRNTAPIKVGNDNKRRQTMKHEASARLLATACAASLLSAAPALAQASDQFIACPATGSALRRQRPVLYGGYVDYLNYVNSRKAASTASS